MTEWKVPIRTDIKPHETGFSGILNDIGKGIEELREAVDKLVESFSEGGDEKVVDSKPVKRAQAKK